MSARATSLARRVDVAAPSLWPGLSSTLLPLLLLFRCHCRHCPPPLSVIITTTNAHNGDAREAMTPIVVVQRCPHPQMRTTSLGGDAPIIVIIGCHRPPLRPVTHPSSSSLVVIVLPSTPPPPDFRCRLLPLLIVKCPPLGSFLVSLNSDVFGTDVGGGIFLEIVIGVAIPIQDGLCCHPQESAPLTVVDNVGSYAPPPSSAFVLSSIIASPSNSRGGRISATGVSPTVRVSKNAAYLATGWKRRRRTSNPRK
jgi:hypothetical protein